METQSVSQRIREQSAAIFKSFCKALEKLDPAVMLGSSAVVGTMLAGYGAVNVILDAQELFKSGGWGAVRALHESVPEGKLQFLSAALKNELPSPAYQALGVAGLIWSGTAITAAVMMVERGISHLRDAGRPKTQAEEFRESIERVRENLDKLNPPGPAAGDQESRFERRGMR